MIRKSGGYFYSELTEDMDSPFVLKYPKDFEMGDWEPLKQWTSMFYFGEIEDYDCNFNRYQEKNLDSIGGWTPDMEELYKLNPEEIGTFLADRWQELRENIITKENLCAKVDAELAYLYASGAYVRNQ